MLIKPTAEEAEKYLHFAWELALDPTRSGYPTYTDGIKTKDDFIEGFHWCISREGRQLLLYLEEGKVAGWIQFLFEDNYVETNVFNIAGDIPGALAEFSEYCANYFPGYKVCMGFPGDNQAAIEYLSTHGWICDEKSFNNVMYLANHEYLQEADNLVRVTRDNFPDFRKLHDTIEVDMYWNSDRLYEAMDAWDIYLAYENGQPAAAGYCRDCDILMEIYGIDYLENHYQPTAMRNLVAKLANEGKRRGRNYLCFFGDDENQKDLLNLGFRCVGEYVMYTKKA